MFPHLVALAVTGTLAVAFAETRATMLPRILLITGLWTVVAGRALIPTGSRKTRAMVLVLGAILGLMAFRSAPFPLALLPAITLACLSGFPLGALFARSPGLADGPGPEAVRWGLLLTVGFAVIHPLMTQGLMGGGDALHYAKQIADMVAQARSGEFPVLVGQSHHAFNGDIHPLRTAPYLQHLGLVIDLITGGTLNAFTVQNLAIVGSFLAAILALYLSLIELSPTRCWLAWLFTLSFATSPAILALVFSGDMIASWMTLPFLPPLFLCLLKLSKEAPSGGWLAGAAVAAAAVWMAHAPIAIWASAAAAIVGLAWLVGIRGLGQRLLATAGALVIFAVLAGYLFASVGVLQIPPDPNLAAATTNGTIMQQLKIGWSGFLRPASDTATSLVHDLQLSPASWLAMVIGVVSLRRTGWRLPALLCASALYLILLYPSEAIAGRLWPLLPDTLIGATEKWPMQRFYPILSVIAPFVGMLALEAGIWQRRSIRIALMGAMIVALGWSGWEARKFIARGIGVTNTVASSERKLLFENSPMSRYSPEYFGWLPRYFSHGVVSPHGEHRLLAIDHLEPLASNLQDVPSGDALSRLSYASTNFGGRFTPAITLAPQSLYRLTFAFGEPPPAGTLVMAGPSFYREYSLPTSGEERAFGAGPTNSRSILAWTSSSAAEPVDVLFLAADPANPANSLGEITVTAFDPALAPVEVTSLVPLRAVVRTDNAAWVETPRLFVPGYQAYANDKPVRTTRSPDGLVMYAVEPGVSTTELRYEGGWVLRATFWLSLASGLVTALVVLTGRTADAGRLLDRILPRIGQVGLLAAALGLVVFSSVQGLGALLATEPRQGTVHTAFTLPIGLDGKSETLAVLRHAAGEESLFFNYVNGKTLQVGLRRADGSEVLGDPFPVNYLARQTLLVPTTASDPASNAPNRMLVRMNERIVLVTDSAVSTTGDTPFDFDLSPPSANPTRPRFSGRILESSRVP